MQAQLGCRHSSLATIHRDNSTEDVYRSSKEIYKYSEEPITFYLPRNGPKLLI